jgi:hypothetical protein
LRLKREVEDLNYKLVRQNKSKGYPQSKNHSNNTSTLDFNSPGLITIDAKLKKMEEEFGSPTTINHD